MFCSISLTVLLFQPCIGLERHFRREAIRRTRSEEEVDISSPPPSICEMCGNKEESGEQEDPWTGAYEAKDSETMPDFREEQEETQIEESHPNKDEEEVWGWDAAEDDSEIGTDPFLLNITRVSTLIIKNGKVVSFKTSYAGKVHAGYPKVTEFSVVFDTGSGHVILPSTHCDSSTCMKKTRFNVSTSEAAQPVTTGGYDSAWGYGDKATIGFGTGKVSGYLVRDRVCAGSPVSQDVDGEDDGAEPGPCVMINNIMAYDLSENPFSMLEFDGICGLGLSGLALQKSFSFFELLSKSGQLGSAHFGVFLSEGDEEGEISELAFGGYNIHRTASAIKWSDVVMTHMGYWQVQITKVYIDGEPLDFCEDGGCRAVADTGTSHLGIPHPFNEELDGLMLQNAQDYMDCRLIDGPRLDIELGGGFNLTLRPENYMRRLPIREDVSIGSSVIQVTEDRKKTGEHPNMSMKDGWAQFYKGTWMVYGKSLIDVNVTLTSHSSGYWMTSSENESLTFLRTGSSVELRGADGDTYFEGEVGANGIIRGSATQKGTTAGNFTLEPVVPWRRDEYVGRIKITRKPHLPFKMNIEMDSPFAGSMHVFGMDHHVDVVREAGRFVVTSTSESRPLVFNGTVDETTGLVSGSLFENGEKTGDFSLEEVIYEPEKGNSSAMNCSEAGNENASHCKNSTESNETEESSLKNVTRHCRPRTMAVKIPAPVGPKLWILGEPILHKYYSVFDWEAPRVGFAVAKNAKYERGGLLKPGQDPKGELPPGVDVYLLQQQMEAASPSGDGIREVGWKI